MEAYLRQLQLIEPSALAIAVCEILLGLVILALLHDRRRWRRLAEDRWLFIQDCSRAARTPSGISFGPTLLQLRDAEQERISQEVDRLRECLVAMEERRDHHASIALHVTCQAIRWARLAHTQRETIRELVGLLANDSERIIKPPVIDTVNHLRAIAVTLTYRHRCYPSKALPDASRLIHVAADMIERGLLRMPREVEDHLDEIERLKDRLHDQTNQTNQTCQQITAAVLEAIEANGDLDGVCDLGHPIEQIVGTLLTNKNDEIDWLRSLVPPQTLTAAVEQLKP